MVIGVDGGGTHTRVRLTDMNGAQLGSAQGPASAVSANGLSATQQVLATTIEQARHNAGVPSLAGLKGLCFGLSGADRPDERQPLLRWAAQHFAAPVAVVNDCEIVLEAGSPAGWGVALIAGTGSIAFGKSRRGEHVRAGGWGYVLGDEGSAYDISRQALRAAVQAADGRGAPTQLLPRILAHWNLQVPMELVSWVYRHNREDSATARPTVMRPGQLATLAPLVAEVAAAGDPTAQAILEQASRDLAQVVIAVAQRLQLAGEAIPLALAGGLLLSLDGLRVGLSHALAQTEFKFAPAVLVPEPVEGAIKIALRLAAKMSDVF